MYLDSMITFIIIRFRPQIMVIIRRMRFGLFIKLFYKSCSGRKNGNDAKSCKWLLRTKKESYDLTTIGYFNKKYLKFLTYGFRNWVENPLKVL